MHDTKGRPSQENGTTLPNEIALENVKADIECHVEDVGGEQPAKLPRSLQLRIDFHVIPMLALILAISIIDRINIGSARVLGMDEDLELSVGSRYSVCLLLFFPSYFLSELPSNMIIAKFGVKRWMSFVTCGFGLFTLVTGFASNWQVLAFFRFMLGAFEGCIFPGVMYILGSWYPRYQLQFRLAILYSVGLVASTFTGLLAYAIHLMDGVSGVAGWSWIFILEGLATMLLGILAYFTLPEFPDRATFLSDSERTTLLTRLASEVGSTEVEKLTWKLFKLHCSDWILWVTTVLYMCIVVPTYSLAYFMPSILQGLGYSGVEATLHTCPPYAAAFGTLVFSSYLADKARRRGVFAIFFAAMILCGMALARPGYSNDVRYFGVHFATMGTFGNQMAVLAFAQNNITGSSKRMLLSAMNIAGGAIAGIIGSTVFRSQDAPGYDPGLFTVIALQVLLIVVISASMAVFWQRNRRADRDGVVLNGIEGWRHTL